VVEPCVELRVVQLLSSRLCHDLANPAGAIDVGVELLADVAVDPAEARDLIATSARQLKARLAFLRVAFGFAGLAGGLDAVRPLAENWLATTRVSLDWRVGQSPDDAGEEPQALDRARLVLNLILLAADALPRGGDVTVAMADETSGDELVVRARGPVVRVTADIGAAIEATGTEELSARTVHAFYAARLAERLDAVIRIDPRDETALDFTLARPASCRAAG
jgi:histidine phosphotransferase ChpT